MCECCGGETKNIVLKVNGIGCNHCAQSIEQSIRGLKGIKSVKVDTQEGKINVSFNMNDVNESLIRSAIKDAGYDVE